MSIAMSCNSMVVVRALGKLVPMTFRIGELGFAVVIVFHLSIRFCLTEHSIHIDEEVFDNVSGELTHTIGHRPFPNSPSQKWHLLLESYLAYSSPSSVLGASNQEGTPRLSNTSIEQTPLSTRIKIEPGIDVITIESSDLEDSIPPPTIMKHTPSFVPQVPSTSSMSSKTIDLGAQCSKGQSIVSC